MVENLYSGTSKTFSTGGGSTGAISMTRGVKQGDMLSPLLFNIAMDPLLAEVRVTGTSSAVEKTIGLSLLQTATITAY